jgi:soluble lytic murein transglycosylase-like protein
MNVAAATASEYQMQPDIRSQQICDADPTGLPHNREDETQGTPPRPGAPSSLGGIEKQFAELVSDLTQQLRALERQLAETLGRLTAQDGRPRRGDDSPPVRAHPGFNRYAKIIAGCGQRHEVDPLLIDAVISQESGFRPDAVSKAGAVGLMQLMPETSRAMGVSDAYDPRQNIEAGTTLLRQLLDRYHGQVDLALAAYNAGSGAVDKYGGVPPFPETQAYVRNVMDSYRSAVSST